MDDVDVKMSNALLPLRCMDEAVLGIGSQTCTCTFWDDGWLLDTEAEDATQLRNIPPVLRIVAVDLSRGVQLTVGEGGNSRRVSDA